MIFTVLIGSCGPNSVFFCSPVAGSLAFGSRNTLLSDATCSCLAFSWSIMKPSSRQTTGMTRISFGYPAIVTFEADTLDRNTSVLKGKAAG